MSRARFNLAHTRALSDVRRAVSRVNSRAVGHIIARVSCVALVIALCGASAHAASLDDYRARVQRAAQTLGDLYVALNGESASGDHNFKQTETSALDEARRKVPPRERVEWAGGAVEADNTWLHKELDAYTALAPDKTDEKKQIISRTVERLGALARQLDETAAAAMRERDKEAEKGRLQTILRRPEYNEQASKGGALARVWEWIVNLLKKLTPDIKPMNSGGSRFLSVIARLLIYVLAVGVIIFVVVRFGPNLWNRVSARRKTARGREARIVLGETLAPDETAADLFAEAERLARAGDLRAAIRKAYVAVLCELGDRKIIRLARHKTNRDYLNGVRDRTDLYGALRPLTLNFERHWYGFARASEADWNEYRNLCQRVTSDK